MFDAWETEVSKKARAFYEQLGFSATYRFPSDGQPRYLTMGARGASSIGIGAGGASDGERFSGDCPWRH